MQINVIQSPTFVAATDPPTPIVEDEDDIKICWPAFWAIVASPNLPVTRIVSPIVALEEGNV